MTAATVATVAIATASRDRGDRGGDRGERASSDEGGSVAVAADEVSFEDSFDAEVAAEFGDLGPAGDDRGGQRGAERSGDAGRRRRRR